VNIVVKINDRAYRRACGHRAPEHRVRKHEARRGKTHRRRRSINSGRSGQDWPLAQEATDAFYLLTRVTPTSIVCGLDAPDRGWTASDAANSSHLVIWSSGYLVIDWLMFD
jgi:hypothetical protein